MFGVDPGTLISGKEHTIMPWLRSWRPTYIFVSDIQRKSYTPEEVTLTISIQKELVPSLEAYGPYIPGKIGGYFRDVQKWKMVSCISVCFKK